ncbi:MAG: VCBS repeat-containing protein [Planctomycetota bacterium]
MTRLLTVLFVCLLGAVLWFRLQPDRSAEVGSARPEQPPRVQQERVDYPVLKVRSLGDSLPQTGEWRGKPAFGDFDRDGKLDFAASIRRFDKARIADGIHVFLGDGKGGWTPCDQGLAKDMGYGGIDAADLTADGRLDLMYSGHDLPPRAFANFLKHEGAHEWVAMNAVTGLEAVSCSDVALGDFSGDGVPDLAVMGFFPKTGGLYVMTNLGTGEFGPKHELMPIGDYGAIVRLVDLDGDRRAELLAATSVGAKVFKFVDGAWLDQSDGLPTTVGPGEISGIIRGIAAADLDGDGKLELAIANLPNTGHPPARLFRRQGDRWAAIDKGLPTQESCFDVVFARLGNGTQGLFLAGQHGVLVARCGPDGGCEVLGRIAGTDGVLNVGAGDVDADGTDDVLVVAQSGLRLFAFELPVAAR